MYRIGEFSTLAKTTIKTLRFYEKEKLLLPVKVDYNGYRYYDSKQLIKFNKITSLRQIGLSISEIKQVFLGADIDSVLINRKEQIENGLEEYKYQLSKINYLLEGKNMKYEVIVKPLPRCTVYYKEGTIENFDKIVEFILGSSRECLEKNPNLKCSKPDYCYVNYLDKEYKEKNLKIRYAQAVEEKGIETDNIKFTDIDSVMGVCIYHKGSYDGLRETYSFIMNYIEENNYEIIDYPRECYIDGMWNKSNVDDWLTEIQVPVSKK